jgi:hypothetical protein
LATNKGHIKVIVFFCRVGVVQQLNAAGHAQVQKQYAGTGFTRKIAQQVFSSAAQTIEGHGREGLWQV